MKNQQAARSDFYVDTDYRIIHEDDDILVVDKPAPLAVQPVGSYANLNLHALLKKDTRWADVPIKFVHRLDSETSGVLLAAKSREAAGVLGKQFMEGRVRKEYEAVVFGCPAEPEGEIAYRLGRDTSSRFQTIRIRDDQNGEEARTRYQVIASGQSYSHVRLFPLTGKTHQLRAHMSIMGNPIVGDKIYVDPGLFERYVSGGLDPDMMMRLKLPRLALHATEIEFEHPASLELMKFCSVPVKMIRDFIASEGLGAGGLVIHEV